ncbi:tRNA pseudouridine(13) synthase TruD [Halorhodospira neutriphila]|uniref:tRNA pseudouridine synthase D n=1 Tax=Halorhodospira neutriphila TaxID=168379 RepID=A0ABS1E8N4_9GAMM|nr:tRNA pseudouridine(13) synthase TruD [Halorhodospira neutriphila]
MSRAHGDPLGTAQLRSRPEDFRVEEELGFTPSGAGEHLMLRVRKRGWTTEAVARRLAEALGIPRGRVSFAGLKDRHAETEQWLSAHLPGAAAPLAAGEELADGVRVVAATRNARKLRRGALAGDRFTLRLRAVAAPPAAVDARLAAIARRGVPNYFGAQRFGRGGRNLEQARAWLLEGQPVRGRTVRGLLLSAVRAELFNRVLAARVADGTWERLLPGDRAGLDGRGSHFAVEAVDEALRRRTARGEIHPTGPLAGTGGEGPGGAPAALEAAILAEEPELTAALEHRGVRADRRALRLMPRGLIWRWPASGELELRFTLTSGAYATEVVAELLEAREPEQGAEAP